MRRRILASIMMPLLAGMPAAAQRPTGPPAAPADTAGAFLDAHAASLMNRARDARMLSDSSLRSYTAITRSRMAAGLRMPLKDRTLFRSESAARVRWSRDGDNIIQVLAGREQTPGGVEPDASGIRPFDPREDRLYFDLMRDSVRAGRTDNVGDDDDFYIEHPLGSYAERHYRYQSGDTMVIRLQDGQTLRVAELQVIPRRNDPQTVRGTLWIETGSAAVVRAAFRLARRVDIVHDMNAMDEDDRRTVGRVPLINPLEFDLSLMTVEYSLWDMRHWLPRSMRIEGVARAGVFVMPASFETSYQMLDVLTDHDAIAATEEELIEQTLAEWQAEGDYRLSRGGSRRSPSRILAPRDQDELLRHPMLPPPIWEDAPGFATEAELQEMADRISRIPGPARPDLPVRFGWGPGEPGMLRYNRVEALSVGARVTLPLPHVTVEAVGRIGAADLHPNAELLLRRETMRRTLELRGYHQLATVDESRRALGAGNSLSALLLGRDEGEYFRATGASVTLAPPAHRRRAWDIRLYAEAHGDVERGTHIAVPRAWRDDVFRENIAAYESRQAGAAIRVRPWWGTDPTAAQFGIDVLMQGEHTWFPDDAGTGAVVRAQATLRGAVPLTAGVRLGAELGAGLAHGTLDHATMDGVPPQRLFYLGGASTLRGYGPGTLWGPEMLRGRLELARTFSFGGLAAFGDYARTSSGTITGGTALGDGEWTNELFAAGAGLSLLDGLVRLDLAHGIGPRRGWQAEQARRGWRLDLHVDAVL
ncbi:MAG TPA: hypothetical protein VK929_02575 [Longimicrobiales bacterium]|nr:hypothetical protein [Longimicrobiales bacterium]